MCHAISRNNKLLILGGVAVASAAALVGIALYIKANFRLEIFRDWHGNIADFNFTWVGSHQGLIIAPSALCAAVTGIALSSTGIGLGIRDIVKERREKSLEYMREQIKEKTDHINCQVFADGKKKKFEVPRGSYSIEGKGCDTISRNNRLFILGGLAVVSAVALVGIALYIKANFRLEIYRDWSGNISGYSMDWLGKSQGLIIAPSVLCASVFGVALSATGLGFDITDIVKDRLYGEGHKETQKTLERGGYQINSDNKTSVEWTS